MLTVALTGCAIVVVVAVKVFGHFLFEDPCMGSGNLRGSVNFYYDDDGKDDTYEHARDEE